MRENNSKGPPVSERSALLRGAKGTLIFLFWAVMFGVSYTQPPLYYSNQNQYFLHGLARGGAGFLNEDWLANTADPTPIFSGLVAFTYRHLDEYFFYLYYLLILGVYFRALSGTFTVLSGSRATPLMRLGFLTLLVALHSALLRCGSCRLFGVDYPWYFQAGVANQYLLGAGLQPSVFGVLLVLSVSTFLHDRPLLAVTWSSLAGVMHATYLLSAALLTLVYLYLLCRDKCIRTALFVGFWALLLVSPMLVYNLLTFAPSSPQTFAEAQRLLAHFRIPHHALVERWFDGIACAQIGWIVVAIYLVRGRRLFMILFVTFVLSLVLALVQVATGNDTLALLFPWRTSAILVPIATTIILTRLVHHAAQFRAPSGAAGVVLATILAVFVVGGMAINYFRLGYRVDDRELDMLEYIRAHKTRGETYLLPLELPQRASGKRGAASSDFLPLPRRDQPGRPLSVGLLRFRLFTGAPIYVDFKSIPYKDVEVLEWHARIHWNHKLYEDRDWNRQEIESELARRRITHVITTADRDIRSEALKLVYGDENYRLYVVQHEMQP